MKLILLETRSAMASGRPYQLMENEDMGYAVGHYHHGMWQQVTPWYCYKSVARRHLLELTDEQDYCYKCHKQVSEDDRFCPYCGAALN